jgi:predicted DNA-binding transcriptional regulator YafY
LGFSVRDHLAGAWGIWSSAEPIEVELVFKRDAVRRVKEAIWHPSQVAEPLSDGRLRLILRVVSILEIRNWVLGWGGACEVLRPADLRRDIQEEIRVMARTYEMDAEVGASRIAFQKIPSAVEMVRDRRARRERTCGR